MKKLLLTIVAGATLSACGGSGDDTSTNNSAPKYEDDNKSTALESGIYTGTTDQNQLIQGVVTENNKAWFLYSDSSQVGIDGMFVGKVNANKGSFISKAKDYNISTNTVYNTDFDGFVKDNTINGTIDYGANNSVDYDVEYNENLNTTSLINLVGFRGKVAISGLGIENAGVTFSLSGELSGIGESGCKITGSVKNTPSRKYEDITIKFGEYPCAYPNKIFNGVAYYSDNTVLVGATDNTGDIGLIYTGDKVFD